MDDTPHAIDGVSDVDPDLVAFVRGLGLPARSMQREPPLADGTLVADHLLIVRVLGRGGGGVVYLANDTRLRREVAVKLVAAPSADSVKRLEREAQAMARLSHPNVLVVHEVGAFGDRLYIAMEYVAGGTLRQWLARGQGVATIVAVFVQAARGLQAAHEAGLLHRDFKPDNVLVGDDGRVRVADFGLAMAIGEPVSIGGAASDEGRTSDSRLTRTGHIVGTAAYIAPELFEGRADPRSDQFSFFVALHEALYGVRPFEGATPSELRDAALANRVAAAPSDRAVPAWLRTAVLRGLQADPAERFADMGEVARLLQSDPIAKRRRTINAIAAPILVVGLVGATAWFTGGRDACERASSLAEAWDDARRGQVEEAFVATDVVYAQSVWSSVAPRLDAYAEAWRSSARAACEGTGTPLSPELRNAQTLCLDQRRRAFAALVDVFAAADAKTVERAMQAAGRLPTIATCDDPSWLAATVKPPDDAELAAAVEATRARVARATALHDAGAFAPSAEIAEAAVEEARQLEYAPLLGEALLASGVITASLGRYAAAESIMREAYAEAIACGDDPTAADAAIRLAGVVGKNLARTDEGLQWGYHATAQVRRVGTGGEREADLHHALGLVHDERAEYDRALEEYRMELAIFEAGGEEHEVALALSVIGGVHRMRGEYAESRASLERALEIRERVLGPDHPATASTELTLSHTLFVSGESDEAIAHAKAALATRERALGPDHPDVAGALNTLGIFHDRAGDYERAMESHRRALAIRRAALGDEHPDVASSLENIGSSHFGRGAWALAESHFRQALELRERAYGPDHPEVGVSLANLGLALEQLDRDAEALDCQRRALAIEERALGPDNPELAQTLDNLGNALSTAGSDEEALVHYRRAMKLRETAVGSDHPSLIHSHVNIGLVLAEAGDADAAARNFERALTIAEGNLAPDHPDVALVLFDLGRQRRRMGEAKMGVPLLERCLAIREGRDTPSRELAEVRFELARALVDAGGDRTRARALAELARATHAANGFEVEQREVVDWLAQQPDARPRRDVRKWQPR